MEQNMQDLPYKFKEIELYDYGWTFGFGTQLGSSRTKLVETRRPGLVLVDPDIKVQISHGDRTYVLSLENIVYDLKDMKYPALLCDSVVVVQTRCIKPKRVYWTLDKNMPFLHRNTEQLPECEVRERAYRWCAGEDPHSVQLAHYDDVFDSYHREELRKKLPNCWRETDECLFYGLENQGLTTAIVDELLVPIDALIPNIMQAARAVARPILEKRIHELQVALDRNNFRNR